MKTPLILILLFLLTGCGALPSMKACQKVEYTRTGADIHIEADCRASIGGSIPGL